MNFKHNMMENEKMMKLKAMACINIKIRMFMKVNFVMV